MNKSQFEEINLLLASIIGDDFFIESDGLCNYSILKTNLLKLKSEMQDFKEKTITSDYFFQLFTSIPQKIIVFNTDGEIDFINFLGKEIFGKSNSDLKLKIDEVVPIELFKLIELFINSEKTKDIFEVKINDSSKIIVQYNCSIIKIDKIKVNQILLIIDDVSIRKQEEIELLKATLFGQDLERKRLAHDLHDSLGQELNAIKMYLNSLGLIDKESELYAQTMKEVHIMLNQSIRSIRDISFDLMPAIIGESDLKSSILQLIHRLNILNKVQINIEFEDDFIEFEDKRIELSIYRIIQEFLNNSIKYSKASIISIKINQNNQKNNLFIELKDNGVGFDFANIQNKNGIFNIEKRLESLNAKYDFVSELNVGTELKFNIYE